MAWIEKLREAMESEPRGSTWKREYEVSQYMRAALTTEVWGHIREKVRLQAELSEALAELEALPDATRAAYRAGIEGEARIEAARQERAEEAHAQNVARRELKQLEQLERGGWSSIPR